MRFWIWVVGAFVLVAGHLRADAAEKCRVFGSLASSEYAKMGGSLERSIVYARTKPGGLQVGYEISKERRFDFLLLPGDYELQCTGNGSRGATFKPTYKKVTVQEGVPELDLGVIDMPITETTRLFGQPAPELAYVAAWKNTPPVSLKELRGKVVVLDFWAYYCSICLHHKPDLAKLSDKYKSKGLAVLTVHDASVESIAEMDEKVKSKAGSLPVALDGKGPGGIFRTYGIGAVPAVILIDPQGRVVRRFHHAGDPELEKEVARLLPSEPTSRPITFRDIIM